VKTFYVSAGDWSEINSGYRVARYPVLYGRSRISLGPCTQWRQNDFRSEGICPAQSAEKNFGRAPPLVGSSSTISRFGERFVMGSIVSFLFVHGGPKT